jgi:hypothetical protein
MRSARIAEWILSLVADRERAASAVGDFLEEAPARGKRWFWLSVGRTAFSRFGRSLIDAPIRGAAFAIFAWLVYMALAVVLGFLGWIAATLLWGMGYFLSHHTGMEIVTNLLRLRFDWPEPPFVWLRLVDYLMVWVAAPYQLGRFAARGWRGREVVTWLYLALIWPVLMTWLPFVGRYARASITAVPCILMFVLAGMLRESWRGRSAEIVRG